MKKFLSISLFFSVILLFTACKNQAASETDATTTAVDTTTNKAAPPVSTDPNDPYTVPTVTGNTPEEKEKALYGKIMEVHDQVMPRMAEINRLKRQLAEFKKANPTIERYKIADIDQMTEYMGMAESAMDNWMTGVKAPEQMEHFLSHEQKMEVLGNEWVNIINIQTIVDNAIKGAEKSVVDLKI